MPRGTRLALGLGMLPPLSTLIAALALALGVGVALGAFGGGGSILTVPILHYVLGLEGHVAIATSLFVVGTTSLAGLIAHARRGRVDWRTGVSFGVAGMVGAFGAGRVAHHVPAGILLVGFGVMMVGTALSMLRGRAPAASRASAPARTPERAWLKGIAEGLVVGAVTGFVGAGGGFLVVPALVLLRGLPMDVAVGTSLLIIALKSFAGFAGFLGHTPIDWPLSSLVASLAVIGSLLGSALVARLDPESLRRAFGWFVVAMASFMLTQETASLLGVRANPALVALVAALGTAAFWASRRLGAARRARSSTERPSTDRPSSRLPAGRVERWILRVLHSRP